MGCCYLVDIAEESQQQIPCRVEETRCGESGVENYLTSWNQESGPHPESTIPTAGHYDILLRTSEGGGVIRGYNGLLGGARRR